jgi:hypothetical protein
MPKQTGGLSSDVLNAALHGLEVQKQTIEQHIQQVRSLLGLGSGRRGRPPKSAATVPAESAAPTRPARKRRRFSAETRARMSEAQRKRFAATKKVNEPPAKAVTKKRKLSAAGRKRIIEATKKRWAEYKAKKAAS